MKTSCKKLKSLIDLAVNYDKKSEIQLRKGYFESLREPILHVSISSIVPEKEIRRTDIPIENIFYNRKNQSTHIDAILF